MGDRKRKFGHCWTTAKTAIGNNMCRAHTHCVRTANYKQMCAHFKTTHTHIHTAKQVSGRATPILRRLTVSRLHQESKHSLYKCTWLPTTTYIHIHIHAQIHTRIHTYVLGCVGVRVGSVQTNLADCTHASGISGICLHSCVNVVYKCSSVCISLTNKFLLDWKFAKIIISYSYLHTYTYTK